MPTLTVVVLNPGSDGVAGLFTCLEVVVTQQFPFQGRVERLRDRVIACRRLRLTSLVISELFG